ncbi:hypothetical protein, partial [Sulfolobus acidocaldarius]|uniref:hypothetical protein n=1 Tax=Sulfolobus acidocaldarius TaxID=2285 RepID=UPI001E540955
DVYKRQIYISDLLPPKGEAYRSFAMRLKDSYCTNPLQVIPITILNFKGRTIYYSTPYATCESECPYRSTLFLSGQKKSTEKSL